MATPRRKFGFALSVLTGAAAKLKASLIDTDYAADMKTRLGATCADDYQAQIDAVDQEIQSQTGKSGDYSQLTGAQKTALTTMRRLAAGGKRSGRLAFPGEKGIQHDEFQVGIEKPKTLSAEIGRASKTLAAVKKYLTQIKAEGWLDADTTQTRERDRRFRRRRPHPG